MQPSLESAANSFVLVSVEGSQPQLELNRAYFTVVSHSNPVCFSNRDWLVLIDKTRPSPMPVIFNTVLGLRFSTGFGALNVLSIPSHVHFFCLWSLGKQGEHVDPSHQIPEDRKQVIIVSDALERLP